MKSVRLGGWHRLWIVLSIIYSVFIFLIVYNQYPENYKWMDQTESVNAEKIEKNVDENYLANKIQESLKEGYSSDEVMSYLLNRGYDVQLVNGAMEIALPDGRTIKLTGNETPDQLLELKNKLQKKYDSSDSAEVVSEQLLKEKMKISLVERQKDFIKTHVLIGLVPIFSFYCAGWGIYWVYRGFRKSA